MSLTTEQRELAEKNQGLAWMVANRFHRKECGEDARQELGAISLLALCEAAQGFDEHFGCTFGTYATRACIRAIIDDQRSGGLIHTPRYLSLLANAGHRYRADRDHIRDAQFSDVPLWGCFDKKPSPFDQAEASEVYERVRHLPKRERHVIQLIIAGWNTENIVRKTGHTRQYISRLVQIARARLRARGLKP